MRPSSFSFHGTQFFGPIRAELVLVGASAYFVRIGRSGTTPQSQILNSDGRIVFARPFTPEPGRKGGRPKHGVRDLLLASGLLAPQTPQNRFSGSNRGKAPKEG